MKYSGHRQRLSHFSSKNSRYWQVLSHFDTEAALRASAIATCRSWHHAMLNSDWAAYRPTRTKKDMATTYNTHYPRIPTPFYCLPGMYTHCTAPVLLLVVLYQVAGTVSIACCNLGWQVTKLLQVLSVCDCPSGNRRADKPRYNQAHQNCQSLAMIPLGVLATGHCQQLV